MKAARQIALAAVAAMSPLLAAAAEPAVTTPPVPDPELALSISVELSDEPGNKAALVGHLQRTQLFKPGDNLDITQRISDLRTEMIAKYSAPFAWAGFHAVSHELRLGDYRQFITADKKLATRQGAYRNLYGRQTGIGLIGVGWGLEALRIDSAAALAPYLADYVAREGASTLSVPLIGYWSWDRRVADSLLPDGHADQVSLEFGLPGGDVPYTRLDASHESYWRLGPRVSAGFQLGAGWLEGRKGHLSPLGKRYYGGGVGSVRGYESATLGALDASGANMGANRKITSTVEALWHAFDIGQTPILLSLFSDYGRYSRGDRSTVDSISARSVGVGISVPMPFGIARFHFADPRRDDLRTQRFQFDVRASWR